MQIDAIRMCWWMGVSVGSGSGMAMALFRKLNSYNERYASSLTFIVQLVLRKQTEN